MTNKMCETFDLPLLNDVVKQPPSTKNITTSVTMASLDDPEGTLEHAEEMNEVYTNAMSSYNNMITLALNIEAKNAAEVADSAANFLKIALDASQSKNNSKLRKLKLQLDKERLKMSKNNEVIDITSDTVVANRNELLSQILKEKD